MFFFQAEDGIRDIGVTGVQTCALPISPWWCPCWARCSAAPSGPATTAGSTASGSPPEVRALLDDGGAVDGGPAVLHRLAAARDEEQDRQHDRQPGEDGGGDDAPPPAARGAGSVPVGAGPGPSTVGAWVGRRHRLLPCRLVVHCFRTTPAPEPRRPCASRVPVR